MPRHRIGWGLVELDIMQRGFVNLATGTFEDAARPSIRFSFVAVPRAYDDVGFIIWPRGLGRTVRSG